MFLGHVLRRVHAMVDWIRSDKQQKKFLSYIHAVFSQEDGASVLAELAQVGIPRPYGLKLKVVYSPAKVRCEMEGLAKRCLIRHLSESAHTYVYDSHTADRGGRKTNVPFLVVPFAGDEIGDEVSAVVSICDRRDWIALRRLLARQYPGIVPVLLSQLELLDAADALKQYAGYEIRVTSRSAKERLEVGRRKTRKSVREWTDETLDEMRRTIEERGQILTSLGAEFYPMIGDYTHVMPKASCKIRKDGEVEVSGSFGPVFDSVVTHIALVGSAKLRFYRGRGLRDAHYNPRPLSILYSQPVFEDIAVVRALVALLEKYTNSMHTVIHGNPYMHLRITDLHDGSSFDVWAVPPRKLAIVPGLRATEAAIERLVHFVFDGFREGRIASYAEEE